MTYPLIKKSRENSLIGSLQSSDSSIEISEVKQILSNNFAIRNVRTRRELPQTPLRAIRSSTVYTNLSPDTVEDARSNFACTHSQVSIMPKKTNGIWYSLKHFFEAFKCCGEAPKNQVECLECGASLNF